MLPPTLWCQGHDAEPGSSAKTSERRNAVKTTGRLRQALAHVSRETSARERQANGADSTFVPSRCLHGASSVAKLHSVQVNADRRDDDTWLTWLSSLPRLTGSSGAGKLRAPRSVPITRCS